MLDSISVLCYSISTIDSPLDFKRGDAMKTHKFEVETTVAGEIRKSTGECELYESLEEVRSKITDEHLKLLNSIIVIRSQDAVRRTLQDKQTGLKQTALALHEALYKLGYSVDEVKLMSPEKKLTTALSQLAKK